jgi:aspartate carbamoyltransferase catalytic subunit
MKLEDSVKIMSDYSDFIVIRHPERRDAAEQADFDKLIDTL